MPNLSNMGHYGLPTIVGIQFLLFQLQRLQNTTRPGAHDNADASLRFEACIALFTFVLCLILYFFFADELIIFIDTVKIFIQTQFSFLKDLQLNVVDKQLLSNIIDYGCKAN